MQAIKFLFVSFIFLSIFSFASYAQLGEQAGQPFFNVSLGSSEMFNYSIINSGSAPIGFQVILPALNTIPHNTTPTVVVTPMNGTLQPNSQQTISITVYMPSSNKPGLKWQGILQVVETSTQQSSSSGMGATLRAGVAKIVTIESAPPKPLPLVYYVVSAIVVIVIIVIVAYLFIARRKAKMIKKEAMRKEAAKRVKAKIAAKPGAKPAARHGRPRKAMPRRKTARKTGRRATTKRLAGRTRRRSR